MNRGVLISRTVLNRWGDVMNESTMRLENRSDALALILRDLQAFPESGYDPQEGCYWARTNGLQIYTHRWKISGNPTPSSAAGSY